MWALHQPCSGHLVSLSTVKALALSSATNCSSRSWCDSSLLDQPCRGHLLVRSTEKRWRFPNFSLRLKDMEGDLDPAMAKVVVGAVAATVIFLAD